jgi:hypothetical protein
VAAEGGNQDLGGQILRREGRLDWQTVGSIDLYSLCHLLPAASLYITLVPSTSAVLTSGCRLALKLQVLSTAAKLARLLMGHCKSILLNRPTVSAVAYAALVVMIDAAHSGRG